MEEQGDPWVLLRQVSQEVLDVSHLVFPICLPVGTSLTAVGCI